MVTAEKRTLQIEARMKDLMSRDLTKMEKALVRFGVTGLSGLKTLIGGMFSLKTALAGLVGGFAAFQAVSIVRKFGEEADALLKLSKSTGDAIENLSELQAALELSGVKSEQFDGVLRALLNSTRKAVEGSEEMGNAFAAVGLTIEDLQRLSPSQVFERMSAGLEGFSSEQERAIALSKILPRQFLAMLPLLGGGLQKFQDAIKQVREVGATVTEAQAQTAERLNDSIALVEKSLGGVGRALIQAFGPRTIAIFESLSKAIHANKDEFVQFAEVIGNVVLVAISSLVDAVIGVVELIETFKDLIPKEKIKQDIAEVQGRLNELHDQLRNFDNSKGLAAFNDLKAQAEKVFQEREKLARRFQGGLAADLKAQKRLLEEQLADLTKSIRASAQANQPKSPDETAAILGLPDTEDLRTWHDSLNDTLKELRAKSVFQKAPANRPLPSPDDEPSAGLDISQLQGVPEFGSTVPSLQAVNAELEGMAQHGVVINAEFEKMRLLLQGTDFWGGFNEGVSEAVNEWTNFAQAGMDAGRLIVDGGLTGLTNAFADIITGTKSAKEAFKDFARQMLADLAQMIAKLLVMKTLEFGLSAFGFEDGGVLPMERGGVVRRFASGGINRNGGVARRPTVLFGEGRNAEAFVPLPDNRSIPVSFVGPGASGGQTLNINITAMDGRDVQRVLLEQQGTLRAIWTNQAETRNGMRQVIKRATA